MKLPFRRNARPKTSQSMGSPVKVTSLIPSRRLGAGRYFAPVTRCGLRGEIAIQRSTRSRLKASGATIIICSPHRSGLGSPRQSIDVAASRLDFVLRTNEQSVDRYETLAFGVDNHRIHID